jgi:pyrimidine operon attenuation protein/uracil phosphoribosyltransferase
MAERGARELPISPDWLGAKIEVRPDEDLVLSNESGRLRLAMVTRP